MPSSYFALGGDILVNPGASTGPRLAYLTGGRLVVGWQQTGSMLPPSTFFQVYSAHGTAIGPRISLTGFNLFASPSVAAISGDRFVVTFAGGTDEIRARIYDANGVQLGSQLAVATEANVRDGGDVISLADGGFLVSWGISGSGASVAGRAQRYDAAGNKVGAAFSIQDASGLPAITQLAGGELVFTWSQNATGSDVFAILYNLDGTPAGPSFKVNEAVEGTQSNEKIASLASGGFVIVWQDSQSGDIKGRLYDADGGADSAEFLVTTVTGSQTSPSLVALPSGGFLVSWTDSSGTGGDASGTSIKGQYFDDNGVKLGGEVLLNSTTTIADQSNAALGVSSTGEIAVGFIHLENPSSAANRELRLQLLEPAGPAADTYAASPDFVLASGIAAYPSMTALAGGGFALSWEASISPGVAGAIRTQVYDALGQRVGAETLLSSTAANPLLQGNSDVASLSGGGYVVIWSDDGAGSGSAALFDVKAQRFDAGGNKVGAEIAVNTVTDNGQFQPVATGLAGGAFVAIWSDRSGSGGDSAGFALKAQLFDSAGNKAGGEFLVNTTVAGDQIAPSVATLASGRFLVSWATNGPSGTISAQLFEADGTRVGGELTVGTGPNSPEVVELAGGGFVIAWVGPTILGFPGEIRAQIFDAAGNEVGAELAVNSNVLNTQRDPVIAALPDGRFVVAWTSFVSPGANDFGIKAQIFEANGERFGGEFLVNQISAGSQQQPSITVLANGHFVIGWSEGDKVDARLFHAATGAEMQDDAFAGGEAGIVAGNVFADNGAGFDLMPFGNSFTVGLVNGAATAIGKTIILASGALLTMNADGTFTYNPNDAFNHLWAPGSGSPSQATDSFTYGAYGDAAVVTITITGVDPAPGTIQGTPGNDGLGGTAAGEIIDAFAGNDYLFGFGGADTLIGGLGNDYLDGGGAADVMRGGLGDDIYIVDDSGDSVVENEGGGFDQVYAAASFVLAANAEIEVLAVSDYNATTAINLTGNAFIQQLFGNAGANVLNGGGGAEAFYGGGGDDTYYIDTDDVIVEAAGAGFDTVFSSGTFALAAGVEVEVLAAADPASTQVMHFIGNEFGQQISGNAAANILVAGGGVDTLAGGGGNDIYMIDGADAVNEASGGGRDQVYSSGSLTLGATTSVEVLSVNDYASTVAINLSGNALGQQIFGNDGANMLDGGGGVDALYGRGGADGFVFTAAPEGATYAFIADFNAADDTIWLLGSMFTGIGLGALDPGAFVTGTAAQDLDDRIIYDQGSGKLFYDADGSGSGAAIEFATLQNHPTITAQDFMIF